MRTSARDFAYEYRIGLVSCFLLAKAQFVVKLFEGSSCI